MPKKPKKTNRTIEAITADIERIDNSSRFEIGTLLIEAKELLEHGEWGDWLAFNFDWSEDTAENYMAVARLGKAKFRKLSDFPMPASVLYALARLSDADQECACNMLVKALEKTDRIKWDEGREIVSLAPLVREHGDLPRHLLQAIKDACEAAREYNQTDEWKARIIERIKTERPDTDEAIEALLWRTDDNGDDESEEWDGECNEAKERAKPELRVIEGQKTFDSPQAAHAVADDDNDTAVDDDVNPPDDGIIDLEPHEYTADDDEDRRRRDKLGKAVHLEVLVRNLLEVDGHTVSITEVTAADVAQARDTLDTILNRLRGGNVVQLVADRAEARSRSKKADGPEVA